MWQIKTSESNIDKIESTIEKFDKDFKGVEVKSGKSTITYDFGTTKVRFLASHKKVLRQQMLRQLL